MPADQLITTVSEETGGAQDDRAGGVAPRESASDDAAVFQSADDGSQRMWRQDRVGVEKHEDCTARMLRPEVELRGTLTPKAVEHSSTGGGRDRRGVIGTASINHQNFERDVG